MAAASPALTLNSPLRPVLVAGGGIGERARRRAVYADRLVMMDAVDESARALRRRARARGPPPGQPQLAGLQLSLCAHARGAARDREGRRARRARGHLMRYVNPADGGWAMPTMATMIRLLPKGFATRAYRSSDSAVFVVVGGRGHLEASGQRFDLAPRDVFVVPGWISHTLHASEELVLFSYSDRVAQEKLGFFREGRL